MKTKIFFSFLLFSLFTHSLFCQDQPRKQNFLSLGLTPLNLLDPITPALEGAVEIQTKQRFNLEVRLGGLPSALNFLTQPRDNEHYTKWKVGLKYRFKDKANESYSRYGTPYVGVEYLWVNHTYDKSNDWLKRDGEYYTYTSSMVHRTVEGFRLKYGYLFFSRTNWVFEFYGGLGIRTKTIDYNTVNEQKVNDYLFGRQEWATAFDRVEEKRSIPDFLMGIKISYRLLKW